MALLLDFRAWHSTLSSFMATTIINARLDGWISGYLSPTSWWELCALDTAFWLSSKRKFLIWFLKSVRIILRAGYNIDISCLENTKHGRDEWALMLNSSILKTKGFNINTGLWGHSSGVEGGNTQSWEYSRGRNLYIMCKALGFWCHVTLPVLQHSYPKIEANLYFKLSSWKIRKQNRKELLCAFQVEGLCFVSQDCLKVMGIPDKWMPGCLNFKSSPPFFFKALESGH